MPKSIPTRVDEDVFAMAQVVGPLASRSAAQQVNHWARIGREVEAARTVSQRAIADALARRRDYDTLSAEEQAVVRADWAVRMVELRSGLDLAETFAAEGRSYAELDEDGVVVVRPGSGRRAATAD